jgi:glycosyltransferase involved in cell wall biosynthesis
MKVLLVTQYFYPENFKSNDIAFELKNRGYNVDVLAGIPNYPEGKYYKGYNFFRKRMEIINGVRVFRAFQVPRGANNGVLLAINYLSYAFFASLWAFILSIFQKYDCVVVHQTSPITQGFPAVLVKKIQKIPMYFWVLDIWPDAMTSGGGVTNKSVLTFIDRIVKYMYNNSDKILISSEEFEPLISSKGDYKGKIEYFPNWSDDLLFLPQYYPIPELPKGFIIMIAGNLGISQNLDAVMQAALELKNEKTIKWVLIGEGSKKGWVDNFIETNLLKETVFTYGKFPLEAIPAFYKNADAMLLTLSGKYSDLQFYVPARLQSYMAAGRPVLGMIDGAATELIRKANCGYSVKAGDYKTLAKTIREKVLSDLDSFEKLGLNGREYFEKHFQKDICIDHLCEIINEKQAIKPKSIKHNEAINS